MPLPFRSAGKKAEEVNYEKMVDENENNAAEESKTLEEPKKGLVSTVVTMKVDNCCLNPKKCCALKGPISQKVIEVVKKRLSGTPSENAQ